MRNKGFTLIELLVTLAIVGILAIIAIPSFTEQVAKSRRSEAIKGLGDLLLRQERWRSNHTTYGTEAQTGKLTSDFYDFAITVNDGTDALMTATPKGAQAGDRCGTYSLRIDNDDNNNPAGSLDKTTSTGASNCNWP